MEAKIVCVSILTSNRPQPVIWRLRAVPSTIVFEYLMGRIFSLNSIVPLIFMRAMSFAASGWLYFPCIINCSALYCTPPCSKSFVPTTTFISRGLFLWPKERMSTSSLFLGVFNEKLSRNKIYFFKQCAAVTIHLDEMMLAPQKCQLSEMYCNDAWYGARPSVATFPPTIRGDSNRWA